MDFLYDTRLIQGRVCLFVRRMGLLEKQQNVLTKVDAEEQDAFKQEDGASPELGRMARTDEFCARPSTYE